MKKLFERFELAIPDGKGKLADHEVVMLSRYRRILELMLIG